MIAKDIFELTIQVFQFVDKSWKFANGMRESLENENTPPVWYTYRENGEKSHGQFWTHHSTGV